MADGAKSWERDDRRAIADVCHRLYDRGYLVATSGNVSVRSEGGFLITPAATRKDAVTSEMIVACGADGRPKRATDKPSSETAMHAAAYLAREDVGAAIHAHPRYCLACSLSEISLTDALLPELAVYIGPVPTAPYATPGTEEMSEALAPLLPRHNAFLLSRHGVLVLGRDLMDAYNRLEHLEHVAHVAYLVSSTGTIEPLTKAEIRKLTSNARRLGQQISQTFLDLLDQEPL